MTAIKSKKAQFKIQQMAFMLLAVILFFILVGLFFFIFKFADLGKRAGDLEQESAVSLALSIAESPEFRCGTQTESSRTQCVDADKLIILKNKPLFSDLWAVSKIEVRKIYPLLEGNLKELECTLANYPECNLFRVYDSGKQSEGASAASFVQLCRKESSGSYNYEKCELGEVIIKI